MPSEDPRGLLARSYEVAASVISGVGVDQWHLPTPCTEFDVDRLTAHLVGAAGRPATVVRGEVLGELEPFDQPPARGWAGEFKARQVEVADVWSDDALLARDFTLPWGTYPGAAIVLMYAMEATAHSWDLAVATGQEHVLDDAVASALLPAAMEMVPAGFRGGEMPFAPVVEISDEAAAADRLAAYRGRTRRKTPTP